MPDQSGGDSGTVQDIDLEDMLKRLREEQGRQINQLTHISTDNPQKLYEIKGRIFAMNTVLYYLKNEPEPRDTAEEKKQVYRELAKAEEKAFESKVNESEDNPEPVDLGNEVY